MFVLMFLAFISVVFAILLNQRHPQDMLAFEGSLSGTQHLIGVVVATLSAFAILFRGLAHRPVANQANLVLPLLAGAMLVSPQGWIAVALAAIAVVVLWKNVPAFVDAGEPPPHDPTWTQRP